MSPELIAQIAIGGMMSAFMWGLNGKLNEIKNSLTDHRDNIRELYQNKVDNSTCQERRDNCQARA